MFLRGKTKKKPKNKNVCTTFAKVSQCRKKTKHIGCSNVQQKFCNSCV